MKHESDTGDARSKFDRMVALLRSDRQARDAVVSDLQGLLDRFDLTKDELTVPHDEEAYRRAVGLLERAAIDNEVDPVTALRRLGEAARGAFPDGFEVEVDPLGVALLERTPGVGGLDITGTGTTKCTFSPWDGCKPDVDG